MFALFTGELLRVKRQRRSDIGSSNYVNFGAWCPRLPFHGCNCHSNQKTKETIITVLRLSKFVKVSEGINKANVSFGVQYIMVMRQNSPIQHFRWILDERMEKKSSTERTIMLLPNKRIMLNLACPFFQGNDRHSLMPVRYMNGI